MYGAPLRTLFEIDRERFEIDGIVAFANVPGNLQRPNLPLGIGIQFDHPDATTCNAIARVIQDRLANLEV